MKTTELKFYPKRELSIAQQQRISDHKASVTLGADGSLDTSVRTIITPKGNLKEVSYKTIRPDAAERVMTVSAARELFEELAHVNIILTNACNLSCSYCYEQHNKDYGQFTVESLKQVYDFQLACNDEPGKIFQFFGGEPLIHKQLILDFITKYHEELERNSNSIQVSMITNGLLLTPEFIAEYFSHNFTCLMISLDTYDATVDHREIGQDKINNLLDMIGLIPQSHKDRRAVSIRCTIAMENSPLLYPFIEKLYAKGIRTMVIHPLTMSSVDGFMEWDQTAWENLHQTIVNALADFPDLSIQFSEGVGVKGGSNCMIGSDMIAVDGSGDYSGCYFFTNQKEAAHFTILGNILHDAVYVDRYHTFQTAYDEMFIAEEQCRACDLKGFCYQCPAGNTDSGHGRMFRPDNMCQKIVRLFLDLQDDIIRKSFVSKFQKITEAVGTSGEERIFATAITHLMYKHVTKTHLPVGELNDVVQFPPYETLLGYFWHLVEEEKTSLPCACDFVPTIKAESMDIKTFYENMVIRSGKTIEASKMQGELDDVNKRAFYLTLLHMLVLNQKGDKLDRSKKVMSI